MCPSTGLVNLVLAAALDFRVALACYWGGVLSCRERWWVGGLVGVGWGKRGLLLTAVMHCVAWDGHR